jgi:hypothetical protein
MWKRKSYLFEAQNNTIHIDRNVSEVMHSNKIFIRKQDKIPENSLHILMRSAIAVENTAVFW